MAMLSGRDRRRALRARDYLQLHLTEPVRLKDVTQALRTGAGAMSASTVRRALYATWGMGFHKLLERLRVERLLTALATDLDAKVEPLGLASGWRGKANLYAAVRRVTTHSLPELRSDPALLASALAALRVDMPPGCQQSTEHLA